MFRENRDFWIYIAGTIVIFFAAFFLIARTGQLETVLNNYNESQGQVITQFDYGQQPETEEIDPTIADYQAVISTSKGEITIDLFENNAPNTVNNFIYLADKGYYDGTTFHRLIPNVLIQGGSRNTINDDPGDDQYGGPGYVIDDEINWQSLGLDKELQEELSSEGYSSVGGLESKDIQRYRIAMASPVANKAGSQFFIVLGSRQNPEISQLRGRFTVFAEVIVGREIVDQFTDIEVERDNSGNSRPLEEIRIDSIKIVKL